MPRKQPEKITKTKTKQVSKTAKKAASKNVINAIEEGKQGGRSATKNKTKKKEKRNPWRPEVWTEEEAILKLEDILDVVVKSDIYHVLEAVLEAGITVRQWHYMNEKYSRKDGYFSDIKKAIDAILESRIASGISKVIVRANKVTGNVQTYTTVHPSSGIFLLKSRYNYVDKGQEEELEKLRKENEELKSLKLSADTYLDALTKLVDGQKRDNYPDGESLEANK